MSGWRSDTVVGKVIKCTFSAYLLKARLVVVARNEHVEEATPRGLARFLQEGDTDTRIIMYRNAIRLTARTFFSLEWTKL